MTRFRQWRINAGLSVMEVADAVGLSREQVHRIEAGRSKPPLRTKVLIARRLDCRLRDLFEVEDLEDVPA